MNPEERLIGALDVPEPRAAAAAAASLEGTLRWLKVGSMLFVHGGAPFVRDLVARGWSVFVDLKLHDIPYQVAETVATLADLGASLLTVHAAGGRAMLEAAARAAQGTGARVVAVTVLTSLDGKALSELGLAAEPSTWVLRWARLAVDSGLAGVVASPHEAAALRAALPEGAEIVTPGVRPAGVVSGDQRRVATPAAAMRAGATRLVVGRPIFGAADPVAAARDVLAEIGRAS